MWSDFFKIFSYAFAPDPLAMSSNKDFVGAGTSQDGAMPNLRGGEDIGPGKFKLRDTTEFIDQSAVTNRLHRYKEYERIRNMPEIETAMTVMADEACLCGSTRIPTPQGIKTLARLAAEEKGKFLCYAYDFEKQDYTLAWAHSPRKTKTAKTIKVVLDDGKFFICTPDHKILLKNEQWIEAGELQFGSELMPFYHLPARQGLTHIKNNQFPRIWTHDKGWIHERQFVDEWSSGKVSPELKNVNTYCKMMAQGLSFRKIAELTKTDPTVIQDRMERAGFSCKEVKWLGTKLDRRRVIGISEHKEIDVYDLTVDKHHNFATEWGIVHNCQEDDEGRVFKVEVKDKDIKEELEFLFFHRKMLNLNQNTLWNIAKRTFIQGDDFYELIIDPDNPKSGVMKLTNLPVETMYRIETTQGRLVEFQQAEKGPDYDSIKRIPDINDATEADLQAATAVRFRPEQIIHIKVGDDRKTFYPYGVSLLEAARSPAAQLHLMEDAMTVYRLSRAPERRVFYIDTMQLPPYKAEAFVERMKDQFKKRKVPASRASAPGASSVEERWHAPAIDEDYWIPIRPNTNTRVETLPGATNLGEVDDVVYFRNKLFAALNFPKNYFNNEDAQATRISLSAQDVKFARMIERLQSHIEDALWQLADRHLRLRGYPEECYEDLQLKMTPPSDWRELTRAEVLNNRVGVVGQLKGLQIFSDFDLLVKFMHMSEDEAKECVARGKMQKLDDLRLQILASNPNLLGIGLPNPDEPEVGVEPAGPSPNLSPGGPAGAPPPMAGIEQQPPQGMKKFMDGGASPEGQPQQKNAALPDPSEEDILRFNLEIQDFSQDMEQEEIDFSTES